MLLTASGVLLSSLFFGPHLVRDESARAWWCKQTMVVGINRSKSMPSLTQQTIEKNKVSNGKQVLTEFRRIGPKRHMKGESYPTRKRTPGEYSDFSGEPATNGRILT